MLGRRRGYLYLAQKGQSFDDEEMTLFASPALFGPSLGRRASISSFLFTRSFAIPVQLVDARRRFLDEPFLSPLLYLGTASPSARCD